MDYIFNTAEDQRQMLAAIGIDRMDELFGAIPRELRLDCDLTLPPAMGELELTGHLSQLAARNQDTSRMICFLGAGSYDHFIPAVVDAVAGRGEFSTSYTPYQPEVSQGSLQAMFEYQSLICQLTGMDVSNASLYDGGSAAAEAVLMCLAAAQRPGKVVLSAAVHPEYRQIIRTYLANTQVSVFDVPLGAGTTDPQDVAAVLDGSVACVVVQHPNFFGCLEDVPRIAQLVHQAGAYLVQVFDPISLGLLRRPGDLGADVAVAEGQSLGSTMSCGGPYLGILACRDVFLRRMPGRIAGQTVDRDGQRCWVLTLQTREQHIRRERATSNICTNQGLLALRAAVYLAAMGPVGLRDVADLAARKARYAAERITKDDRLEMRWTSPFFKEFVVRDRTGAVGQRLAHAARSGVLAGVPLGRWYRQLHDCFLVAVTEKRTRGEIDRLATVLAASDGDVRPQLV